MDSVTARVREHFADSIATKQRCADSLPGAIAEAAAVMVEALRRGGKIMCCGNGGSAADSQHFAAELVNRFEVERPGRAALALSTDTSTLTSIANDYAFDLVFATQVKVLGKSDDVLLAISTSGDSCNIVAAIAAAHDRKIRVVALTGNGGGRMAAHLEADDVHVCVDSSRTARIQEVHGLTLHCLCDAIDQALGTE